MDPHSPKDVREAKKQAKADAREVDEFLRQMLALRQGRKYFWNLLASCGIARNPFSTDPLAMAFASGEMNVGQRVLADIVRVAPERYIEMMREANDRSSDDDGSSGGAGSDRADSAGGTDPA